MSGIEDRASPPFCPNYYSLYIYPFSRQRSIIFQVERIKFSIFVHIFIIKPLVFHITRFLYIYIRNKTNYYFTIIYVISMYTTKSRRNIYELTFRRAFNTKQTIYCTIYTLSIHVLVRVVEASSNRVEPSNASVDIIFHRLERITSLVNYCPYRFGSVGRGRIAEERDDIITIINPECPSLCQGGARGRILSTNGGLIHGFPLLPPVNPSLGTRCTHDAEYPSGRPTLPPGGRGGRRLRRGFRGGGREGQTPELEFVHTGLVRRRARNRER